MQYVLYVRLALMVLAFLVDLIKGIKQRQAGVQEDSDVVERGLELLSQIGQVAGVKELNSENVKVFLPEIKLLVSKVAELKKLEKLDAE